MISRTSPLRKMAVAATSLAAVAALAAPVSAQQLTDTTELTLTINETGFLSITAPENAAAEANVNVTGGTAEFDINGVVISDTRTTPGIFVANAVSEDLTATDGEGATIGTIGATNMNWVTDQVLDADDVNVTGVAAGAGGPLAAPGAVIAAGLTLTGEAVDYDVSGVVTVTIPAATPAGEYTATMTTSVQ